MKQTEGRNMSEVNNLGVQPQATSPAVITPPADAFGLE